MAGDEAVYVFWNGELVGTLALPLWDMFNVSGRWTPCPGTVYDSFIASFGAEENVRVVIRFPSGSMEGEMCDPPEEDAGVRYDLPSR
ncbi:MAG: hypothetical protein K2W96_19485 [Gemmataceae bacterium]|nr:hypothetical protein [Gemmataceae bacterium]